MTVENSLNLLFISKALQKCMKLTKTTIESSQKHPNGILIFTMTKMIAAIQLIYNKKSDRSIFIPEN